MKSQLNFTDHASTGLKLRNWFQISLLTIILINSCVTTVFLIRNGYLVQANNILLEKLMNDHTGSKNNYLDALPALETQFAKLMNIQACPPCPTPEPPVPIIPNKDPVSVLNEQVGKDAKYDCTYVCVDPPLHTTQLVIEDYEGVFLGKGLRKINAKKQAAYRAIIQHFPELVDELEYDDVIYNPPCQDLEFHEAKESC